MSSLNVLIDGVAVPFNQLLLEPNQIESVTVLSDVLDKSKEGPMASYGAILIKTRKGEYDTPFRITVDAQTGVKTIFAACADGKLLEGKGIELSSANSINIGRLAPQITYYFKAYADLLARGQIKMGDKVNFCVPTGNFGNIFAGFIAKLMGLPIGKLVCASNDNKVLYDFFQTGTYDKNREFILTTSPSMDILISSNHRKSYM